MLEVRGFRGYSFSPDKVGALDHVVTPPWDVITPDERRTMVARNPYCMARVMLPEPEHGLDRYEAAARNVDAWIAEGALRQETADTFYLLEQTFTGADGTTKVRRGFLGVSRLPEPGEKLVLGHERTFQGPVDDRVRLTVATRANLEPVFVLYSDPEQALAPFLGQMDARPPDMQMTTFDGVLQRAWRVPQDDAVTAFFRGQTLYIADGHHRFRTATVYRDTMRAQEQPDGPRPYDYILMGFVSFSDPGLQIDPPHRLVPMPEDFSALAFLDALAPWFEVEPVTADLPARLAVQPGCAFGLAIRGHGEYLLTLRDIDRVAMLGDDHGAAWRNLDIAVLHRGIIERLLGLPADTQFAYVHNAEKALESVRNDESGLAFLVKPVHPEEVRACAEDGDPMPQKATYFFPKLPTGIAIHRLA